MNAQSIEHRLERMLGFLEKDPGNPQLLGDTAAAAFDAQKSDLADELLDRHVAIAPLPQRLTNLKGTIALARGNHKEAAIIFESLLSEGESDPAIRFNLAWAKAMLQSYEDALSLLDEGTVAVSPRGPWLIIHVLHHLNRYDDALTAGAELAERYPSDEALMGALATLALDAEKVDLALAYGQRSGRSAEGRAALGFLALGQHDADASRVLFEQALATDPANPRAWIGIGLERLVSGDPRGGADAIDRGAEIFRDHIGSWVASGWAHFVSGDSAKARQSFERALAIDDTFSESHGGLAVLAIVDGDLDEARRRADIALRLDKKCLGGALAKSILLEKSGHAEAAQRIRQIALTMPIGVGGQTIAQAMAGFAGRMVPQIRTPSTRQ